MIDIEKFHKEIDMLRNYCTERNLTNQEVVVLCYFLIHELNAQAVHVGWANIQDLQNDIQN